MISGKLLTSRDTQFDEQKKQDEYEEIGSLEKTKNRDFSELVNALLFDTKEAKNVPFDVILANRK